MVLALQPTAMHTPAFFGNGDEGEYGLSKKFINNTTRGPKAPFSHYTAGPIAL